MILQVEKGTTRAAAVLPLLNLKVEISLFAKQDQLHQHVARGSPPYEAALMEL